MRTMNPVHEASTCAVAATAEIVGAKWTALLVHDLSEGPRRFSELERSCQGISPRTLAERLRALEADGILERQSYPETPPRVEYSLTAKGASLLYRWLQDAFAQGRPFDQVVREMLTAEGSSFGVPPANFLLAAQHGALRVHRPFG